MTYMYIHLEENKKEKHKCCLKLSYTPWDKRVHEMVCPSQRKCNFFLSPSIVLAVISCWEKTV